MQRSDVEFIITLRTKRVTVTLQIQTRVQKYADWDYSQSFLFYYIVLHCIISFYVVTSYYTHLHSTFAFQHWILVFHVNFRRAVFVLSYCTYTSKYKQWTRKHGEKELKKEGWLVYISKSLFLVASYYY